MALIVNSMALSKLHLEDMQREGHVATRLPYQSVDFAQLSEHGQAPRSTHSVPRPPSPFLTHTLLTCPSAIPVLSSKRSLQSRLPSKAF